MVIRPVHLTAYEFVVVSALRTQQLIAGSVPRLGGQHRPATMAQMEVAGGWVMRTDGTSLPSPRQCRWQL
jgi:DNA-directed RNA polymerase subunit K/omega